MDDDDDPFQINDDDDTIASKKKRHILELRHRVDDLENELFHRVDMGELEYAKALQMWSRSVRQYIRYVEPLLKNDELEGNEEVYKSTHLGTVVIDPPEGLQQLVAQTNSRKHQDVRLVDGDEVAPVHVSIDGVKTILDRRVVTAEWTVQIRDRTASDAGSRRRDETFRQAHTIDKRTLENAVSAVDEWLENAAIHLEYSRPAYMGGDEPGL